MADLTIFKTVPTECMSTYVNLGWGKPNFQGLNEPTDVTMRKVVHTAMPVNIDIDCSFRQPYLIQRALIRRPLGMYENATLSAAAEMDYMGAAEFEYGALPKSLRACEAQWQLFKHHVIDGLTAWKNGNEYKLRMYANFDNDAQRDQYVEYLREIIAGKGCLHEWTNLEQRGTQGPLQVPERTDFWWDIQNCVFFTFDKQFMNRVDNHLRNSFQHMAIQA